MKFSRKPIFNKPVSISYNIFTYSFFIKLDVLQVCATSIYIAIFVVKTVKLYWPLTSYGTPSYVIICFFQKPKTIYKSHEPRNIYFVYYYLMVITSQLHKLTKLSLNYMYKQSTAEMLKLLSQIILLSLSLSLFQSYTGFLFKICCICGRIHIKYGLQ